MRILIAALLLSLPLTCVADASRDIAAADGWASWQVPKVAGAGEPCCYDVGRSGVDRIGCDLDGGSWGITINGAHSGAKPTPTDQLTVYAHVRGGKVDKVRAYAATCPMQARTPVRAIAAMTAADSVAWLERQIQSGAGAKTLGDETVTALAFHADAAAQDSLVRLAGPGQPQQRRESALFWLGQARGEAGLAVVERFAHDDAEEDIRRHAVFVLSQADEVDTYPKVLAIARSDRSGEVRSQSLFWLAQMEDARAAADITAALRQERDAEVREQAVFALSQLPDGQNDAALIAVMRGDFPREVKQKALFWLGQSGSDAALAFLDDVLR